MCGIVARRQISTRLRRWLHVEKHVFDMAGRIEALFVFGEAFDIVF
jgi:hypothetical protein